MATQDIIEEFVITAKASGKAQMAGNSNMVNQQYGRLTELFGEIRADFKSLEPHMQALLSHDDGYVRLNAALCLIPLAPEGARAALIALSREPRTLGFVAEMTLEEWDAGRLTI